MANNNNERPLKIGDRVPLPRPKLTIRPSRNADDSASSPRGVFRNGRGGSK
jgi:hypothetical protein